MAFSKTGDINKLMGCKRNEPRARSNVRSGHKCEVQSSRSHSVEQPERKILNVDTKFDVFLNVTQAFENILNQLDIDENCELINEKLVEIQNLIKRKINLFKLRLKEKNSLKFDLESKTLGIPKSLASSMQSLSSEISEIVNCLDDVLSEFLIKVSCPFCSKYQDDKIILIKHLDENCEPHKNCEFEKSKHMPFSTFQILPNNTFKCNICPNSVQRNYKKYITHLCSEKHVSTYNKVAQNKVYSEKLFCSCCKIQVANTYTQINFHITHEIHKLRSENVQTSTEHYLRNGIHCVYIKSRKFKCLICPPSQSLYETPKEILQHLEKIRHVGGKNNNTLKFYCEFCSKEDHIYQIISHFNKREHKNAEKCRINAEGSFELCFYCGFVFNDLMALSKHMKSKCLKINDIRENDLKSAELEEKNLQESEVTNDSKVAFDIKEYCVIVKDNLEMPKLFKYFSKFGEIIGIETYKNKDVKIKFRKEKTVEDILLLRNVLQIDGIKLEVTTDEKLYKSIKRTNRANNNGEAFDANKKIGVHQNFSDESDDSNAPEDYDLQDLFYKVSSHLVNNVQKTDSDLHKKLSQDCIRVLGVEACSVVGFSGCELSFPMESISFYCKTENMELNYLHKTNQLEKSWAKMYESELWERVTLSFDRHFSNIECVHKETQRACTITFTESTVTLTNLLRDCLENNDIVQHICLIIRFWLSVHELKIRDFEYTIISILVFFLIKENIVNFPLNEYFRPRTLLLLKAVKESVGFNKSLPNTHSYGYNVTKLFHKFLLFLETFNFDKNAICLPIEYPVPKALIKSFFKIPDSDQLLKSSLCIFDPVSSEMNLAVEVTEDDINSLLRIVRSTINHYKLE